MRISWMCSFLALTATPIVADEVNVAEMRAAYRQNAASVQSVEVVWDVVKIPGDGAFNSQKYIVEIGKKAIKLGGKDPRYKNMANAALPITTSWAGSMVTNRTGVQLAFRNDTMETGSESSNRRLPLPLDDSQFASDVHDGWSIFGWGQEKEFVRCMIGQRQKGLLTGARLAKLPEATEFQFPPLMPASAVYGGISHAYGSVFEVDFVIHDAQEIEGRKCVVVQHLGEPLDGAGMADIPKELHGRYKVFSRVRSWLDRSRGYLPIRTEFDVMATYDGEEVQLTRGPHLDRVITAELSSIPLRGDSVWFPALVEVSDRRIDPLYDGPYEDDFVGLCEGTIPPPDYPYVVNWTTKWTTQLSEFSEEEDLALNFPPNTFYMDRTQAAAMFVGLGAKERFLGHRSTPPPSPSTLWPFIFWANVALIVVVAIVGVVLRRRRQKA